MISEFIARYLDRPFIWGVDDCSLWLADWWQENHGIDPAAHLRGTYSTEGEKIEIVRAAGGLVLLVEGICKTAGAREVFRHDEIKAGDFGIIAPGVGGIYTGDFWAHRNIDGVGLSKNARPWRVWAI